MKSARVVTFIVFLIQSVILSSAWAGWTTTALHPAGNYISSAAHAVSGGQHGGYAIIPNGQGFVFDAAYWSHPAATGFVDIASMPAGGEVFAVGGGRQAGYENTWATWWKGTKQPYFVDTNNSVSSFIYGLAGNWGVGSLQPSLGGPQKATVWKLTDTYSEPPLMLAPAGSSDSRIFALTGATATDPGRQAGLVDGSAAYWSGTAASYVNLGPSGVESSIARAAYGDYQGGWVETQPDVYRAARWTGTAQSLLDLQPDIAGITDSQIFGMAAGVEVGRIYFGPNAILDSRAFLWWDSATVFVNLPDLLPKMYTASRAEAVDWFDGKLWVAGTAWNGSLNREEAMLWTYSSVPEPSTFLLLGAGIGALALLRSRKA